MHPYAPAPSMPGKLKAVRIILIIRVVLAALVYALAFLGVASVAGLPSAQVEAELGMTVGGLVAVLLLGVAITVFEIYTIVSMGKGGTKAYNLLRVVVGLGFANALLSLVTGSTNPALGIALMAIILVLVQNKDSQDWFRATDPNAVGVPGGPGGYPQGGQGGYPQGGYPGQGGYPDQSGQGGYYPQGGQGGYPQGDQGGYPGQGGYPNQPGR